MLTKRTERCAVARTEPDGGHAAQHLSNIEMASRRLCPPLYEISQEETQKTRQGISVVSVVSFFVRSWGRFFAPTALGVERRAQPRSRLAVTVLEPRAHRGQAMP
jgi:hypothetical protein